MVQPAAYLIVEIEYDAHKTMGTHGHEMIISLFWQIEFKSSFHVILHNGIRVLLIFPVMPVYHKRLHPS